MHHAARGGSRHRSGVRVRAGRRSATGRRPTSFAPSWPGSAPRCSSSSCATGFGAPTPQTGEPTYAAKIEPADLEIDWSRPAVRSIASVRVGRAWTTFRGQRLWVLDGRPIARHVERARRARPAWTSARARRVPARRRAARGAQAPRRGRRGATARGAARRTAGLVTDGDRCACRRARRAGPHRARGRVREPRAARGALSWRSVGPRSGVRHRARLRHAADAASVRLARRSFHHATARPARAHDLRLGAYQLAFIGTAPHAAVNATVAIAPSHAASVRQRDPAQGRRRARRVPGRRHPLELSGLDRRPPHRRPGRRRRRPRRSSA